MPRLIRPAFKIHTPKDSYVVLVPDNTLPMDLYNALSAEGVVLGDHGWIDDHGIYHTDRQAAEIALQTGILDERKTSLSITDFKGRWKHPNF